MSRAIRRAELPVWYTQGFNPHPYITFALPLSIFYESVCEAMDLRLNAEIPLEEVKQRLSAQMPEGIEIYDVCEPGMKPVEITTAGYEIKYEFDNKSAGELNRILENLLTSERLPMEKTTKHGSHEVDIKPYLLGAHIEVDDGRIGLRALLPAGQENLNPSCFGVVLFEYAGIRPDFEMVKRNAIYADDLRQFI
jgi:radical SAM-linked protein